MAEHKVRIDKWLWAVRIFKSRSKASKACRNGKVRSAEQILKASSQITPGQVIAIKKDGFNLSYKVNKLLQKRVSFPIAVTCYENLTPEEELNKFKDWFIGKGPVEKRERGAGRPTKRDRREIDSFKEEIYLDDWFESDL